MPFPLRLFGIVYTESVFCQFGLPLHEKSSRFLRTCTFAGPNIPRNILALNKLHYVSVFTLQMLTDIARFVLTRNDDVHIHICSDWFLENTHIVGYITRNCEFTSIYK